MTPSSHEMELPAIPGAIQFNSAQIGGILPKLTKKVNISCGKSHPSLQAGDHKRLIHLKLTVIEEVLIVSFKEL